MTSFVWTPVRYRNVIGILKNPFYAGVYVYGKSEKRTAIVDGRARRSYGHGKPVGAWEVMIRDHHEGYISWEEYERNQQQLALNNYGRSGGTKSCRLHASDQRTKQLQLNVSRNLHAPTVSQQDLDDRRPRCRRSRLA